MVRHATPAVNSWLPRAFGARERGRGHPAGHRAVRFDRQQLGAAEAADAQARAVDDDVAQIAIEAQRARCGAAGGRQADQLAVGAGDMHQVAGRVVGEAARRRADRDGASSSWPVAGSMVDDRAAAAERDVDAAGAVLDDAARLVAGGQRNGRAQRAARRDRRRRPGRGRGRRPPPSRPSASTRSVPPLTAGGGTACDDVGTERGRRQRPAAGAAATRRGLHMDVPVVPATPMTTDIDATRCDAAARAR